MLGVGGGGLLVAALRTGEEKERKSRDSDSEERQRTEFKMLYGHCMLNNTTFGLAAIYST